MFRLNVFNNFFAVFVESRRKQSFVSLLLLCLLGSGVSVAKDDDRIILLQKESTISAISNKKVIEQDKQDKQEVELSSQPNRSVAADLKKAYKDSFDDDFVGKVKYPDWFHQSDFLNYQEDLSEAVDEGKKGAFLLFTTQGCPYCDKFVKLSLGDSDIAKQVQENFMPTGLEIFNDVEIVDFSGEEMAAKDFAKTAGVQFTPTIIFYDKKGTAVFKAIGYQSPKRFKHILNYVGGEHYHKKDLHAYIKDQAEDTYQPSLADQLISGLYEETVARTLFDTSQVNFAVTPKVPSKPLVVLFEEDNCQDCVNFHENVLPTASVRDVLTQFTFVKFNASDNKTALTKPDKSSTTPAQWVKDLDFQHFPALVFFDKTGRKVLQTDAFLRKKRMLYSCQYVLENAFDKGWSYQQFGRFKEVEKRTAKK